jgi:hypothetical protein
MEIALDLEVVNKREGSADGFIVAGIGHHGPSHRPGGWVARVTSGGSVAWQKTYAPPVPNPMPTCGAGFYGVTEVAGGGFVVAGYTDCAGAGSNDFWVLKLNDLGGIEWQKTYGSTFSEEARSVIQTDDNGNGQLDATDGFLVVGSTDTPSGGNAADRDVLVVKINRDGGVQWHKVYRIPGSIEEAREVIQLPTTGGVPGDFVVSGLGQIPVGGRGNYYRALVARLQAAGKSPGAVVWANLYGSEGQIEKQEQAERLSLAPDGGILISGLTSGLVPPANGKDAWAFKLDSSGNYEWQSAFGKSGEERSYAGTPIDTDSDGVPDNGFVLAGKVFDGATGEDFLLVKLSSTGFSGCCNRTAGFSFGLTPPDMEISLTTYETRSEVDIVVSAWSSLPETVRDLCSADGGGAQGFAGGGDGGLRFGDPAKK